MYLTSVWHYSHLPKALLWSFIGRSWSIRETQKPTAPKVLRIITHQYCSDSSKTQCLSLCLTKLLLFQSKVTQLFTEDNVEEWLGCSSNKKENKQKQMTQTLMSFIISVSALGYFHLKAFPFHTYLCSYYYANYCLFFICGVCHNVSQFNHRLIWKTLLCFVLPQVGVFENFGCLLNSLIRWQCKKTYYYIWSFRFGNPISSGLQRCARWWSGVISHSPPYFCPLKKWMRTCVVHQQWWCGLFQDDPIHINSARGVTKWFYEDEMM